MYTVSNRGAILVGQHIHNHTYILNLIVLATICVVNLIIIVLVDPVPYCTVIMHKSTFANLLIANVGDLQFITHN